MSPLKKHLALLLNFKKNSTLLRKIIVENNSKATKEIYTQVSPQEIGSIINPFNNF
tara:strand:+ start:90 stop:257 length:168 start_codon:yes stop_codon:yes gene_type:complete